MFLDSGDGLVFKGAVGPWRSANKREYHVSREGARTLLATVVDAYKSKQGYYPSELFIHGHAAFSDDGMASRMPCQAEPISWVFVFDRATR